MHGCPGAEARCLYGSHGASLGCSGLPAAAAAPELIVEPAATMEV